jgi:hypothetical protein
MRARTDAVRRIVELAGIGFQVGGELGQIAGRKRRVHDQDGRRIGQQRDRREVLRGVESEVAVERRIGGEAEARHQELIAVGLRARDLAGAKIGVGAGAVDHQEGLPEPPRQPVGQQPRQDVGAAACRKRHDQLDRAGRVFVLRQCRAGARRKRCNECRKDEGPSGSECHALPVLLRLVTVIASQSTRPIP